MMRWLLIILVAALFVLVVPHAVFSQTSSAPILPEAFERSIIFVDGTNLFYRFEEMKLLVGSFFTLFQQLVGGRQRPSIRRICWYTIEEKYRRTLDRHGAGCLDRIRVIRGTGVATSGEPKEKGVDALLVADLIYHAAQKNMDYAQLVTIDLDFVYAIRRVEDFGCRSAVLAFGREAPEDLKKSCDDYRFLDRDFLLRYPIVTERTV